MSTDKKRKRELEEKLRPELAKIVHKIVNDYVQNNEEGDVTIIYARDIRPRLNALEIKVPHYINIHRICIDILRSTKELREVPNDRVKFRTTKKEFIEFHIKKYLNGYGE